MALMSSCFATAELTDKLAISGVVWQGASQEVHQAGFPAGAAWVPHFEGCRVHLPCQHVPCPACSIQTTWQVC